jgi:hypothetical protein
MLSQINSILIVGLFLGRAKNVVLLPNRFRYCQMGNAKNINEMDLTNQCIVLVKNWGLGHDRCLVNRELWV